MVRTTIMLPKEDLMAAKIRAVQENKTLSQLIADTLKTPSTPEFTKEEALKTLGGFKIGIKKAYESRDELYEDNYGSA